MVSDFRKNKALFHLLVDQMQLLVSEVLLQSYSTISAENGMPGASQRGLINAEHHTFSPFQIYPGEALRTQSS